MKRCVSWLEAKNYKTVISKTFSFINAFMLPYEKLRFALRLVAIPKNELIENDVFFC